MTARRELSGAASPTRLPQKPMLQSRRTFLKTAAATISTAGCGTATTPTQTSKHAEQQHKAPANMPAVTAEGAKLDHPLLQRLHELDRHIRDNVTLPRYADAGVGAVGLNLSSPLKTGGYFCSPRNALMFANTRGDGDHYSLLINKNGVIDESSPVILTWPSENKQIVAGESLHDFLCFGMHSGYFQLFSGDGQPTIEYEGLLFHSHVEPYQQKVIALLARELNLKPWPQDTRGSRYQRLQEKYLPLLDVPEEP